MSSIMNSNPKLSNSEIADIDNLIKSLHRDYLGLIEKSAGLNAISTIFDEKQAENKSKLFISAKFLIDNDYLLVNDLKDVIQLLAMKKTKQAQKVQKEISELTKLKNELIEWDK